jgi:hypothetical protein
LLRDKPSFGDLGSAKITRAERVQAKAFSWHDKCTESRFRTSVVAGGCPVKVRKALLTGLLILAFGSLCVGQAADPPSPSWSRADDGTFSVLTASEQDALYLPQVYEVLKRARRDLRDRWQLELPAGIMVVIHPDLASYTAATGAPWFVSGIADRAGLRLEVQRLRVLLERNTLERTLRHELFHLAQPDDWPRWRAEGSAMRFAGELPSTTPYPNVAETQLEAMLAAPASREELARANATAYWWVVSGSGR